MKARTALLALVLMSNGIACSESKQEALPPAPRETQQPLEPELLLRARAARGAGYAERYQAGSQISPARHYLFSGIAHFVFHEEGKEPGIFDFEVALASPSLQRYQLTLDLWKNWFLLGGPGDSWLKTPNDSAPRPNSAGAEELEEDAALRWLILGFPASLERAHARNQAEQWSELWKKREPVPLAADFGRGDLQLWLEPSTGLPKRVERRGENGRASVLLTVQDWTLSYPGSQGERLYPRQWNWQRKDWVLEEKLAQIEDCALFLDTAFRPVEAPMSQYQVWRGADGSTQRVPDERFALVAHSMRYRALSEKSAADNSACIWEFRNATERQFVEQLEDDAEGEGVEVIANQLCLLWSTPQFQSLNNEAEAWLSEIAAQNGFETIGPIWVRTEVVGLEVLVPVRKRD